MSNIPADLKYARTHEWVRVQGDLVTVGISDHAQRELTDLVFVELPPVGKALKAGDACAVVESVKTASEVYAPVSGQVVEINTALVNEPGLANQDPYGAGWFFKLRLTQPEELNALLTPAQYAAQIGPAPASA